MEEFVNVFINKEDSGVAPSSNQDFYGEWIDHASAKHSNSVLVAADALRRLYPKHSLVTTMDFRLNLLNFPAALAVPLENLPLVTNLFFVPLARSLGSLPGVLIDQVVFGAFKLAWDSYDFLLFTVQYPLGSGLMTQSYILHEGPEAPARSLLISVGAWAEQLHDEIWVFNQGIWRKDHSLWSEVQKADWKDVILREDFKKTLKKDVDGFFSSKKMYEDLAIPWKRGLIMYGPPGNGKTITLKAIMKACGNRGFPPLYIKSFQSFMGEEASMAEVFNKARQMSPCIVVLEDLDSLINDGNRSFFLNQLDGLERNDGLLIIGTTNHFDRLDPGLSSRPSRFDRKFEFDDPDAEERTLYVRYWQKKLENNKEILFPEDLVNEVVGSTEHFSFAYMKEAFVSSLVMLASHEEGTKPFFAVVLRGQIKALKKQLDKPNSAKNLPTPSFDTALPNFVPKRPARPNNERDIHALLDALSDSIGSNKISTTTRHYSQEPQLPSDRDFRLLLDRLSESVSRGDITPERAYSALWPSAPNMTGRDIGKGARYQPMRAAQRIPASMSEQNFPETSSIPKRATYRNEVWPSGSVSTLENYNYPEFLSQGTEHIWGQ
ncbi:P-loop containing nucleoside triphosphate hydrolase protein [Tricholoma matsutake]|nr:P-loop containing nucleoside triphosphate hydrolase protein [Tricholoma matsutake 945]